MLKVLKSVGEVWPTAHAVPVTSHSQPSEISRIMNLTLVLADSDDVFPLEVWKQSCADLLPSQAPSMQRVAEQHHLTTCRCIHQIS